MSTSKKINVSHAFHQRLDHETTRLKLSYKEYLEAAGEFFIARKIDPRKYQVGQTEELAHLLRLAIDHISSLIAFQEQHILRAIHTEAGKARIMGELSVNHLLRLLTDDEGSLQALQQQDLTQRLRQVTEQLNATKLISRPHATTTKKPNS